jgi:phospholipid/cholesterol/gamma-HCH transport system substrate-binding protein
MASRRFEVGVGLLVLGAAGLLAFMAIQIGALRGLGEDPVEATVFLDNVAGLSEGAVVAIAGVSIGRVDNLSVEGKKARVALALDTSAEVRIDAVVAMRARSVLGEKYLEIVPQSPEAPLLKDGDVLANTLGALEIDQLVNRLGPVVDAVDPQVLSDALRALTQAFREDPERLNRLLGDVERLLHNLAVASDRIDPLIEESRGTLASVRRVADSGRPVVAKAESAVGRLDELLAGVPPERVDALLAEVEGAVKEGRAVIVKLDRSTGQLEEILTKVNGLDRADLLRITQEEGVLIRLRPRKVEDVLAKER